MQVVLSMIVASFLHKVSPYFSVGRGLITYRLRRYQTPSDALLRPHVSVPPSSNRGGGGGRKTANQRNQSSQSPELPIAADIQEFFNLKPSANSLDTSLTILKSANIKLQDVPVRSRDLIFVRYSEQLEWMINMSVAAIAVYVITLAYYFFVPSAVGSEYNLSTIWLLLVCGYIVKVLASLTSVYFSHELASQRSVGIVFTMLFFVCALGILLIDEGVLEFGLERSHKDISQSIARLIGTVQNQTDFKVDDRIVPIWVFKITLALCATLLSGVLIFSGFRFADVHFGALRFYAARRSLMKTVFHTCYITPMFCLSLWIRPLSRDVVSERNSVNLFGITEVSYDNFRFGVIVSVCLLRVLMYSTYMQSFLDTAKIRVSNMGREQGRITIRDLRDRVSNIFDYYPATGVHYLAPFLLLLMLTLLLHMSSMSLAAQASAGGGNDLASDSTVNVYNFSGFGISVFHGIISFMSWWICFTNAVTSGLGPIIRECV